MTAARSGSRVSARWRIAGWITVTTTLGLAALVFSMHTALANQVIRDADADVGQHAAEFRSYADGPDPRTGLPFAEAGTLLARHIADQSPGGDEILIGRLVEGGRTWAVSGDGLPDDAADRLLADPGLAPRLVGESSGAADSPIGPVRWVTTEVVDDNGSTGRFVALEAMAEDLAETAQTSRTVTLVAIASAIVTAGCAVLVAGQVLRPLRNWRATVLRSPTGATAERIPVEGDDDLAAVARTVNEVLDRMQATIEHEQVFVEQARRELAVPLAAARRELESGPAPRTAGALEQLARMDDLIDDLQDLAASRRPEFVRPVGSDLGELARDLLDAARTQLPDRQVTFTEIAAGRVELDPDRVRDAVLRLTDNADRAAPAGQPVQLATALAEGPDGPELRISVTDHGPGLTPAQVATAYDRLVPEAGTDDSAPRRGLGLAHVRAVADAHGGAAYVRSRPGGGATFGLALPVRSGTR